MKLKSYILRNKCSIEHCNLHLKNGKELHNLWDMINQPISEKLTMKMNNKYNNLNKKLNKLNTLKSQNKLSKHTQTNTQRCTHTFF
jgi:hypothetical protein